MSGMAGWLWAWLAWGLAFAGFMALALAMPRHARDLVGRALAPAPLRLSGALGVAASLPVCLLGWPGEIGVVAWFGVLTAAAGVCVLVMAARSGSRRATPRPGVEKGTG